MKARLLAMPLLGLAGFGLLVLPGARRLPAYHPTTLDGVTTINDAVRSCRATGLQGWELIDYAQKLVARKFSVYSTINLWDPPNHAFVVGMGYCTQYNLALKNLLRRLGVPVRAVFSLKVRVSDNPDWVMGHTWLQVTLEGETREVCAARVNNEPGQVHFTPLLPTIPGHPVTLFVSHLGTTMLCGLREWWALLTGQQPASWSYIPDRPLYQTGDNHEYHGGI